VGGHKKAVRVKRRLEATVRHLRGEPMLRHATAGEISKGGS
jgi:hypothetical protein